jgi:hypothetical protein
MCELVCDVSYLCYSGYFATECEIANPIVYVLSGISIALAILKFILLWMSPNQTILYHLLFNHACADIYICFILVIFFDQSLLQSISLPEVMVFLGNLLGCAFTLEITLYAYSKLSGSVYFENNIKRIISVTYFISPILGYADYLIATTIQESPYILIGFGGLLVIILNCLILIKTLKNYSDIVIVDKKLYVIYPTLLAISWNLACITLIGNTLSSSFFWVSFIASLMNYIQPLLNSLLYGPMIIQWFKNRKKTNTEFELEMTLSSNNST